MRALVSECVINLKSKASFHRMCPSVSFDHCISINADSVTLPFSSVTAICTSALHANVCRAH